MILARKYFRSRRLVPLCCGIGLLLASISSPPFAASEIDVLEERAASSDPAIAAPALQQLLEMADRTDALAVMHASMLLFNAGKRDEAVYWFYAGQLRARYTPELTGENGQILTAYLMAGTLINAYAQRDVAKLVATMGKVLQWDDRTFKDWAWANDLDIHHEDLINRRKSARDGLEKFATQLSLNRATYEQQAREIPIDEKPRISTTTLAGRTPRPTRWTPVAAASSPFYLVAERSDPKGGRRFGRTEIVSRADMIAGRETQYWIQRYYEWLEKNQKRYRYTANNVQKDETGGLCNSLQNGPVWFLTNHQYGKATRTCEVSRDVYIMIPVLDGLVAAARGRPASCEELVAGARKFVAQGSQVQLSIDGAKLESVPEYEGATGCVERVDPGNSRSKQLIAVHGYWVFLKPLAPGNYRIEFRGEIGKANYYSSTEFVHEVTYLITVK